MLITGTARIAARIINTISRGFFITEDISEK
jgi:hypothetical protein